MATNAQRFDRSTFLSEFPTLCHSLGAPCSQQMVEQILAAFDKHLDDSYVWLRCTSRPGDVVNFRLAFHGTWVDTTAIAAHAGWIDIDDPLAKLVRSWSSRDDAEQWCDFDPSRGIAKNWIYFHRLQPIQDIMGTPGLPAPVAARVADLQAAGLDQVNFAAVDYDKQSINVYFLLPGGLTSERAASYTALAGSTPLSEADVEIMRNHTHPMFTFAVTIAFETGHIPRVAFYATVENAETFSPLNDRLRKFFAEAPSHDQQKLNIISWSYGAGDSKTYMKGESNYAGYQEEFGRDMFTRWIENLA